MRPAKLCSGSKSTLLAQRLGSIETPETFLDLVSVRSLVFLFLSCAYLDYCLFWVGERFYEGRIRSFNPQQRTGAGSLAWLGRRPHAAKTTGSNPVRPTKTSSTGYSLTGAFICLGNSGIARILRWFLLFVVPSMLV
jgi:hypothetical protein